MNKKTRNPSVHHVHFDSTVDGYEKNNDIIFKKINDDEIEVHVGFLQLNYKYIISFPVPRELLRIDGDIHLLSLDDLSVSSTNCHVSNITHEEELIKFELNYDTRDIENDVTLKYKLSNSDRVISIILTPRILGTGKGTPLLKNGVHCVGAISDDDSEGSDHKGND